MTRLAAIPMLSLAMTACDPVGHVGGTVGKAPAISLVSGSAKGGSYGPRPCVPNGAIDTGHPSVGLLTRGGGCTATLIGKRTALTAAHCLDSPSTTLKIGGRTYNAAQRIRHPSYAGGDTNDIGLIVLGEEVAGVKPSPIAASPPARGQAIVLVGFGKGLAVGSPQTKRMGSNSIASLGATTFSFNASHDVCDGDSGGPSFVLSGGEEIVVGVHSTKSGFCGRSGTDTRVDAHRQWIASSAAGDLVAPSAPAAPPSSPPPGVAEALEGQSCATIPCRQGLACGEIFRAGFPQLVGKVCLERCATLGDDSNCDGHESCTASRNAGQICFNPDNPTGGFCSGAVACDGTTAPTPAPAPDPPAPPPSDPPAPEPPKPSGACGGTEESQVFELLNQERAAHGLGPLSCDPVGLEAARAHSQDMCARGYFDHYTPEGLGPWDRLGAAGAQFGASGENIAMGYSTPHEVHSGWMNSSGHRDNILTPSWQRAAIGLATCGGTPYWTEVFMD